MTTILMHTYYLAQAVDELRETVPTLSAFLANKLDAATFTWVTLTLDEGDYRALRSTHAFMDFRDSVS